MSDTQILSFPDDQVLNIRKTAALTGLSIKTLERLQQSGNGPKRLQLSAQRVGYRMRDLRAWLNERTG